MELQVDVLKVELKGTDVFELRCKAETSSNGEILSESSPMDLSKAEAASSRPQLTKVKTKVRIEEPHLAKFRFRFKKHSPVAALLFTAVKSDVTSRTKSRKGKSAVKGTSKDKSSEEEGEIGHCLFPITFRPSESTSLGSLAVKADELVGQTQTGFLMTKMEGMNMNKVVGRLLFKVYTHKPVPKKSLLKTHTSYLDLKISQEKLLKPAAVENGPTAIELSAREQASLCDHATMPGDSPKVNVMFHCAASAKEENLKDLRPIACLGMSSELREDGFFKDNSSELVNIVSILKPVSLQCVSGNSETSNEVLELHLCGGSEGRALFSSAHPLQTFYPFRHHNWEYNWRWLPGTQTDSLDNFQSTGKEPKVVLSVVYVPPASDFADYEGLEVLIQQADLEVFAKDRFLIACVQLLDNDETNVNLGSSATQTSPFKQKSPDVPSSRNFNIAAMHFGTMKDELLESESEMTEYDITPAYFFFDINAFFRNKRGEHSLQISLYSMDKSSTMAWWKDSYIALISIRLPPGLKKILPNPENQGGVRCNLVQEDITQPDETPLVNSITVVLRWKTKEMPFLDSTIIDLVDNIPLVQDLVYSQTETEVGADSLYNLKSELPQHSHVFLEEYKTAITKMGLDILKLRQENDHLSKENKRLERHMIEIEASIVVTAADQRKLHPLSKPDLIHRVVELSEHLVNERQSRKGYQDKVRSLQNQLIEKNDVVSQHVRLQEAHEAQQKLVRELQSKVEKYRKCCDTSKKQESVINQLEALLSLESGDRRAGNALSIISKENADLRATLREYQDSDPDHRRSLLGEKEETIASLRKELEKMAKQRQNLEEQLNDCEKKTSVAKSDTYLEQTTRVYELEQRLKVAEARENTLMNELEENGRRWAQEKARYEILVTELQAKWESLNKTKEEVVLDKRSALSIEPSRPLLSQSQPPPVDNSNRDRHRDSHHNSYDHHNSHHAQNNMRHDSHHPRHTSYSSHPPQHTSHPAQHIGYDSHHQQHTSHGSHPPQHNTRNSHPPQHTNHDSHRSQHTSYVSHPSQLTSHNSRDYHSHDSHHHVTSCGSGAHSHGQNSHESLSLPSQDSHVSLAHGRDGHHSHQSQRRTSNLLSSQSMNPLGQLSVSLDDMITF